VRAGIAAASAALERFVLVFGEDVGRDRLSTDHERKDVEAPYVLDFDCSALGFAASC
jgi:hypothetical protein